MLDTIEQIWSLSAMMAYDMLRGEHGRTAPRAMVPMLNWPADLFNRFTTEVDDEFL